MLFSLLFLGLAPLAFTAHGFSDDMDDTEGHEDLEHGLGTEPTETENGDFFSTPQEETPETTETSQDDVADEDDALQPNSGFGNEATAHSGESLLDLLLGSETDQNHGREDLEHFVEDINETQLTDDADFAQLHDDGLLGTGTGNIDDFNGTPVLQSENGDSVELLDAGDGDDTLLAGDDAAYIFANDGNDDITSGEGAIAAFGGNGDDVINAKSSIDSFLDGGTGDDILMGGAGDDQIFGGSHENNSPDTLSDNDTLSGGDGDDDVQGGYGADILSGGAGDDVINHLGHALERSPSEIDNFDIHIDGDQDILDGGEGNDTLIMDGADIATGGEGDDVFWVYANSGGEDSQAEITDFVSGHDFLRITVDPEEDFSNLEYDVQPSDTGEDGIVTVNGNVVATLKGAPDATILDVYVDVSQTVYA